MTLVFQNGKVSNAIISKPFRPKRLFWWFESDMIYKKYYKINFL